MANDDHAGYKKIQCWIKQDLWDKIESLNFPNQTNAVTEAFKSLLDKSQNIPDESQDISNESQNIPQLRAQIEGLQLLIEEKDKRIEDLRQDKENLSIFAHYFKSLQYKQLEASTEPIETFTQEPDERLIVRPGEAHIGQEEREIVSQPKEEKPAREPEKAHTGKKEGTLIMKTCKNCNQPFETSNTRKETCSDKCRIAFSRRKKIIEY